MTIIEEAIAYLNQVAGTNYQANYKPTVDALTSLIEKGYELEHFKLVVDKKSEKWKSTKYEVYLRPLTLFGKNFETYINEPRISESTIRKYFRSAEQAKRTNWKLDK